MSKFSIGAILFALCGAVCTAFAQKENTDKAVKRYLNKSNNDDDFEEEED